MPNYYPGSSARLQCSFYVSSALTDPTTITLQVMAPSGTTTAYTYALAQVTKSGTGVYYKDVTFDVEGTWKYRWVGTGTCIAATEGEVEVTRSPFS